MKTVNYEVYHGSNKKIKNSKFKEEVCISKYKKTQCECPVCVQIRKLKMGLFVD